MERWTFLLRSSRLSIPDQEEKTKRKSTKVRKIWVLHGINWETQWVSNLLKTCTLVRWTTTYLQMVRKRFLTNFEKPRKFFFRHRTPKTNVIINKLTKQGYQNKKVVMSV